MCDLQRTAIQPIRPDRERRLCGFEQLLEGGKKEKRKKKFLVGILVENSTKVY